MRDNRLLRQRARELRRAQTGAEQRLWHGLRQQRLGGLKFRRQVPIDRFIADFYCASHKLIIEVDGAVHAEEEQARYDEARTAALEAAGYRVLRFSNTQVEEELPQVLSAILQACMGAKQAP
jgi:very-short-patch-repair endonuclease